MTFFGPCIEIQPRRLKSIFTPYPATLASLGFRMFNLGLLANLPSSVFILIFNPGLRESNKKVLHELLKMTTLGLVLKYHNVGESLFSFQISKTGQFET